MNRGFTLLEMLVVLAIIVFMVSTVLANTHGIGLEERAKAAAGLVIDTLKDTRDRAVSVKQFTTNNFPSYGIDFNTASPGLITVYADCTADDNSDGTVNNLDTFSYTAGNPNGCGAAGSLVQQIALDPATKISAIRATYPVGASMQTFSQTKVDILYLRPDPTIWITTSTGGLISVGKIDIDLSDTAGKYVRTVTLYSSGEFSD